MRRAVLLAVLLVATPLLAGCATGSLVGKPVPAFSLVTSEGERVNESTHLGRYLILDLMATWCAPCRLEVGHLRAIQEAYGDRVAILSVGVDSTETSADLDAFAREHGATWPHALDYTGETRTAMGLRIIPKLVIVDPQGVVVFEGENEVLPAVIAAAIEGRPVPSGAEAWTWLAAALAGVALGFLAAFNPYRRLHRDSGDPRAAWLAVAILLVLAVAAWPLAAFLSGRATIPSLAAGLLALAAIPWWLRARRKSASDAAPSLFPEAGDRLYEAAPHFALCLVMALSATSPLAFAAPLAGFLAGQAAALGLRAEVPARTRVPLGLAGLGMAGVGLLAFGARILV